MEQYLPIVIAIILAVVAWKILKGMLKIGAVVALVAGAGYLYTQGYLV